METLNFLQDITLVINRYSEENKINTPDFILAQYMKDCLDVLNKTIRIRDNWINKEMSYVGETAPLIFPQKAIKCTHPKEFITEKIEQDCFPYGDSFIVRTCTKCGFMEYFAIPKSN